MLCNLLNLDSSLVVYLKFDFIEVRPPLAESSIGEQN